MKKTLYLVPSAVPGGAERLTMRMLAAHDRSTFERGVLFFGDGPLLDEARGLGIPAFVLTERPRLSRPWSLRAAARECADIVKRDGFSLIHSCMSYTHLVGGLAASMANVPAVLFQHGPVGSWIDGAATVLRCDHILTASGFVAAEQRSRSWRTRPITVVRPAVDLAISDDERATMRREVEEAHGVPPDAFVVGVMARFDPRKGLDLALRAMAPLLRHRPQLRFMVVGGQYRHFFARYEEHLRSIADEEGVCGQVIFAGFQLDVRPYFARLDTLVHASLQPESFGLTIVEAMATGVPVVAANAGGPREIIDHDVDGLLFEPGSEAALRAAVMRVLDDPHVSARLVAAGFRKVDAKFRSPAMMSALDAVYESLCPTTV